MTSTVKEPGAVIVREPQLLSDPIDPIDPIDPSDPSDPENQGLLGVGCCSHPGMVALVAIVTALRILNSSISMP